jgi:two-component system copper resistance phosphate regulon response regulator CusR
MKILVIEDEQKTADYLQKGLTENGFVVDVATNGAQGFHLAQTEHYDLLIVDVMLPDKNGWQIVKELRLTNKELQIMFFTARDSTEDKVHGFDLGADDYLIKSSAFSELLARVRSRLRRGAAVQIDKIQILDLSIDTLRQRASRAGKRLDLTAKEFSLLSLLARHQGEVISRTYIAEQVWDMNFSSDTNVVDVAIRRLRRKVDDPFTQKLIHTKRGSGYILEIEE